MNRQTLERIAARLGLLALVVVGAFLLLQLVQKADHAHALRVSAGVSPPPP